MAMEEKLVFFSYGPMNLYQLMINTHTHTHIDEKKKIAESTTWEYLDNG